MTTEKINAEVIAVYPNKVKISVDNLEDFKIADESLKVGSYLRISDNEDSKLFAIIENFSIEVGEDGKRKYQLEANPLGILREGNSHVEGIPLPYLLSALILLPKRKLSLYTNKLLPRKANSFFHHCHQTQRYAFL